MQRQHKSQTLRNSATLAIKDREREREKQSHAKNNNKSGKKNKHKVLQNKWKTIYAPSVLKLKLNPPIQIAMCNSLPWQINLQPSSFLLSHFRIRFLGIGGTSSRAASSLFACAFSKSRTLSIKTFESVDETEERLRSRWRLRMPRGVLGNSMSSASCGTASVETPMWLLAAAGGAFGLTGLGVLLKRRTVEKSLEMRRKYFCAASGESITTIMREISQRFSAISSWIFFTNAR